MVDSKYSCSVLIVITFFLLLLPLYAWGDHPPGLILKAADDSSLSLNLILPAYKISESIKGAVRVRVDGYGLSDSPGNPQLPRAIYTLALPPDIDAKNVKIMIENIEIKSLAVGNDVEAAPPLAASIDGINLVGWGDNKDIREGKNILVYDSNNPYPPEPIDILSITRLRKWRLIRLSFYPFSFYPKSKKLEIIKKIALKLIFTRTGEKGLILSETPVDRKNRLLIQNISQAEGWYEDPGLLAEGKTGYDFVIITTNAVRDNSEDLENFRILKESFGHSVLIVTEDEYGTLTGQAPNGTAEKIRQWLINNYESMGIVYVLLIGNPDPDSGDVPMKMCWPRNHKSSYKESPTDYFFADLTGNWDLDGDMFFGEYDGDRGQDGVDFDAEVWVGRIPVYGSDYASLDSIFRKIIDYQSDSGDISWRNKALLPMAISNYQGEPQSSYDLTDGAILAEHMISGYLDDNGFSWYTLYEKAGDLPSAYSCDIPLTRDNVKNEWPNGYGLVCWWGHGSQTGANRKYWIGDTQYMPSFFQSGDTAVLDDTLPSLVYQCSCSNGYPENSGNLGFSLLKKGAAGTVSASRISWYEVGWSNPSFNTGDNASLGYYYMERLAQDNSCGEALYIAKSNLTSGGAEIWMNLQDFNLYGDPSLALGNPDVFCDIDMDKDGDVDGNDLSAFVADFAEDCLGVFAGLFGNE